MNVTNQKNPINPAAMLFILIIILLLPGHPSYGRQPSYTFGVVPQHASLRLVRDWVPFLADLSSRSGISLEFRTTKDIPTFERCLAVGAFDFAYMNPYHYIVYHDVAKYIAFARQRDHKLRGLIVVRQDSWIKEIKDLDGLDVAFPSPAAFGASAIQRAELRLLGIQVSPSYVGSHDSVYRTVDAGLFEAGGGVIRTLSVAPPNVKSRLRVLYETRDYTPHAFAHHPDVPAFVVSSVLKAMVSFSNKDESLSTLGMTGFQKAGNSDWSDVRDLNLDPADTGISINSEASCPSV